MEPNDLSNFGRRPPKEQSYCLVGIGQGLMEEMLFLISSSGHHFAHRSGTVCAIFVGNFPRNSSTKFDWNPPSGYGGDVI